MERLDTKYSGFRPDGNIGGSPHQIQKMLPRHFQIVHLHVAGLANTAIAKTLECSPQTVGIVLRSPLVRAEVQRLLKSQNNGAIDHDANALASKARMIIENNAEKAADTQVDLLDSEDDSVRLRSSGSILDRALGKVEGRETSDGPSINVTINTKDVKLLVTALAESKELDCAQGTKPAADSKDRTTDSRVGQGDVHQAS